MTPERVAELLGDEVRCDPCATRMPGAVSCAVHDNCYTVFGPIRSSSPRREIFLSQRRAMMMRRVRMK